MSDYKLFNKPSLMFARISKDRKEEMITQFLTRGFHYSPSGSTAALIIERLQQRGVGFVVQWTPNEGYLIKALFADKIDASPVY